MRTGLFQAAGRIGRCGSLQVERSPFGVGQLGRRNLGYANTAVDLEVFLAAARAIAFARFFVAQTGKFVAAANAIAVAGRRSSLDRHESHHSSEVEILSMRNGGRNPTGPDQPDQRRPTTTGEAAPARVLRIQTCSSCVRRNGSPTFSCRSSQTRSGIEKNTSTTRGSN